MEGRNTSLDDFWRKTQRQIVTRPRLSISVFVSSWSQDQDEKKYPTVNLSFFTHLCIEGQKTHEASFTKRGKFLPMGVDISAGDLLALRELKNTDTIYIFYIHISFTY